MDLFFYLLFPVLTSDYSTQFVALFFDACATKVCVDLSVVDDDISEMVESFYLTLEKPLNLDSRIILSPRIGEVTIYDDDGKY